MSDRAQRNMTFLRAIYAAGAVDRHGFIARPATPGTGRALGEYTLSDAPVDAWVAERIAGYEAQVARLEACDDDGVPLVGMTTATHIYACAFGCRAREMPDSPPMALPRVTTAAEADALEEPDIWSSPTLVRTFELARAVAERLGPGVPIGVPDMQSGFDIACQVWQKTDLYCAMMDDRGRESVRRLAGKCARLLVRFLEGWRREFPQSSPNHCPGSWSPPELGPWVSNDECGAMGVPQFEEFMLPELIEMAERFGGLGMHCCAAADHQFASFKRIPNFYAFNRVDAGTGYRPALDLLGGPDGPVFVLGWIGEEAVAELIRNAPHGTRFIFHVGGETIDDCRGAIDRLRAMPIE